jgi:DNA invertase Pin-like site-specific DNA recombinase
MTSSRGRSRWVSYLRVSTAEQAERELSLTAQRRAVSEVASRYGANIDQEYAEPGASGTDPHRPVLRRLLGDALSPHSAISTIVVHHSSRFTPRCDPRAHRQVQAPARRSVRPLRIPRHS